MNAPLSEDPRVPQHAAADLATGGTEQSAPSESVAPKFTHEQGFASAPQKCPKHNVVLDVQNDCSTCRGEGLVEDMDDYSDDPRMEECWVCRGSGVSPWLDCWLCAEEAQDEI